MEQFHLSRGTVIGSNNGLSLARGLSLEIVHGSISVEECNQNIKWLAQIISLIITMVTDKEPRTV